MKRPGRHVPAAGGRTLRVAVVSDGVYPYFKGGKELRAFQLLSRLPADQFSVQLFTMRWWGAGSTRAGYGIELRGLCAARAMYNGSRRSVAQAVVFSLACLKLWRVRADVIDADHMPYLPLLPVLAIARARRIPVVVTWHEWWGRRYWCEYLGPAGACAAWLERRLARLAPRLIVHTPGTAQQLVAAGVDARRVEVVTNGVDLDAIDRAPTSASRFDVLFVGRLISHKGAHLLVEALAALAGKGIALTCAIVGEGPEAARVTQLVQSRALSGQVSMLGWLESQAEVFGLLKGARTFVLPSVREGYGLAVAEALACGAQVVTTNHKDNASRHLVQEGRNGWLCDPGVEALAAALEQAHWHPLDRAAVAASARALTWEQAVERLADIYRETVEAAR